MHTTFFVISYFSARYSIPVWILCCVQNLFCYLFLYFINVYADRKLQEWSLFSFANEMSEGFVLYNEFDDPIYINDQLKEILSEDLIDSFRKKEELDAWLNDTVLVGDVEFILYNTESGAVYFNIDVSNLTQDNVKLGTGYIFRNVTNSVLKIQEMQAANTELEQVAKMKSDFLANMSHEIRTPMNAVIGMAEIALRENLTDNVRDYLLQIQNSGRNLLNIINDILDFSKIEAGKMEIFPDRYEPLSEINDIANVLVTRIGDKELELFVIADSNIPHALEGDAMRIRQIIINLANNAIKFTQRGTVIINISCENISDDEVMLTYHVIDTGQGISEKDLEKLFVSFQQVDSKRNRSVEGTGLGLAISQRLCEAMGGSIGVNVDGEGTHLNFNLPFDIQEEDAKPVKKKLSRAKVGDFTGKRILVAEDSELSKDAISAVLEVVGFEVDAVENGRKAVIQFVSQPAFTYDAVIMDIHMPFMDGREAAKCIRISGKEDGETLPIIGLMTESTEKDVEESIKAGMQAQLSKPVDVDTLYRVLSRYIKQAD
jgi:signal transduction histidine kinase/CheY-like chemotaxis protein